MAEALIGKVGEEFSPGTILTAEGMADLANRDDRLRYDAVRGELWLTVSDAEAADFQQKTGRSVGFSLAVTLTKEGEEIRDQFFREMPTSCPACGFRHPTKMFVRTAETNNQLACASCGYVLQEGDFWPDQPLADLEPLSSTGVFDREREIKG